MSFYQNYVNDIKKLKKNPKTNSKVNSRISLLNVNCNFNFNQTEKFSFSIKKSSIISSRENEDCKIKSNINNNYNGTFDSNQRRKSNIMMNHKLKDDKVDKVEKIDKVDKVGKVEKEEEIKITILKNKKAINSNNCQLKYLTQKRDELLAQKSKETNNLKKKLNENRDKLIYFNDEIKKLEEKKSEEKSEKEEKIMEDIKPLQLKLDKIQIEKAELLKYEGSENANECKEEKQMINEDYHSKLLEEANIIESLGEIHKQLMNFFEEEGFTYYFEMIENNDFELPYGLKSLLKKVYEQKICYSLLMKQRKSSKIKKNIEIIDNLIVDAFNGNKGYFSKLEEFLYSIFPEFGNITDSFERYYYQKIKHFESLYSNYIQMKSKAGILEDKLERITKFINKEISNRIKELYEQELKFLDNLEINKKSLAYYNKIEKELQSKILNILSTISKKMTIKKNVYFKKDTEVCNEIIRMRNAIKNLKEETKSVSEMLKKLNDQFNEFIDDYNAKSNEIRHTVIV